MMAEGPRTGGTAKKKNVYSIKILLSIKFGANPKPLGVELAVKRYVFILNGPYGALNSTSASSV